MNRQRAGGEIIDDLASIGITKERIIVKNDGEAALVALQHGIVKKRAEFESAVENSRVGDSNSNGKIERAVRNIKNSIRTLRCSIEMATGNKVKITDPVVPWVVRQAGYIQTRCNIGDDGKTAWERITGRKPIMPLVPFGETVMFKLPKVPDMPGDFRDRHEQERLPRRSWEQRG